MTFGFEGLNREWGHPLSTYAKFSKKLTFLTPLIRTRRCAYQGVRNVSFSKILRMYLMDGPIRNLIPQIPQKEYCVRCVRIAHSISD